MIITFHASEVDVTISVPNEFGEVKEPVPVQIRFEYFDADGSKRTLTLEGKMHPLTVGSLVPQSYYRS